MSTEQAKYSIQDTVFTDLFRYPENQLALYQALHPEDVSTTVEDIQNVTLKVILMNDIYNDLGFTVKGKFLFLIEAQSTRSDNIALRAFLYIAKTYQDFVQVTKQNYYLEKAIDLPEPEIYVLYTGDIKHAETGISLAQAHWHKNAPIDVRVKVLYGAGGDDIVSQYVRFTRVYKKYRKQHGRTRKAVEKTIEECIQRNILKNYLLSRKKEVITIMMSLFDPEINLKMYANSERAEGRAELAYNLIEKGWITVAQGAESLGISVSRLEADMREKGYKLPVAAE